MRSAVILVRRPLTPGHNERSENEEGAAESFGGDGLGIDPGVGIGAIEGLGPGFGLSEQALITPVMPMVAVVIAWRGLVLMCADCSRARWCGGLRICHPLGRWIEETTGADSVRCYETDACLLKGGELTVIELFPGV